MSEKEEKKRITVSVSVDLYADLYIIAEENYHSVDKTAGILLKNAIKERKRKRKNAKEDSTSDNS